MTSIMTPIRSLGALVFAALLAASSAHAGPDATTQIFIDDSPSLLDWGTFRLEQDLNKNDILTTDRIIVVFYLYDEDRIVVSGWRGYFLPGQARGVAEVDCANWFASVRKQAGVNPTTGAVDFGGMSVSQFVFRFDHQGYSNDAISGAAAELDKKFWLRFSSQIADEDDPTKTIGTLRCEGPLLGNSFSQEFRPESP